MSVNNPRHHRRSIRLPEYDYSSEGAYYITICAQDRVCLFGEIVNGKMSLNEYGRVAGEEWVKTAQLRPYVSLDSYVVMPNHVHGIIIIDGEHRRGTMHRAPTGTQTATYGGIQYAGLDDDQTIRGTMHRAPTGAATPTGTTERFGKPVPGSLPTIVRCYTAAVTRRINRMRNTPGRKLWQRNYWEH